MEKLEATIYATSTADSYTLYHIKVILGVNVYRTSKRYSDFVGLKAELEQLKNKQLPYGLPRKHYISKSTDPVVIEERRVSLEQFLKDLLRDSEWRNNDLVKRFLELPQSAFLEASGGHAGEKARQLKVSGWKNGSTDVPLSPSEWLDVLRECKSLLQDCRSRMFSGSTVECRKSLTSAKTRLTTLQKVINEPQEWSHLGAGELKRRRDLLNETERDFEDLQTLLIEMGNDNPAVGKNPLNKNNDTDSYGKLFRGKRVLGGKPQETEITRQLDNQALLQYQKDEVHSQDQQLESLRSIIQRQRQIGVAINEELETQNDMLQELDQQVDESTSKMKSARRKIGKILQ